MLSLNFESILIAVWLLPLIAAVSVACFARVRPHLAIFLSVGSALCGALGVAHVLYHFHGEMITTSWGWLELGTLKLSLGFFVDHTALLLLTVVTFIGFLIHVFSIGYMSGDKACGRFFGGLAIFMFSMIGIVLADNLFMLFIFWELVGFSSYMLIAHYADTCEAALASKKAFIVNRVGDFGLMIGILWTYHQFGTVHLLSLREAIATESVTGMLPIALLLMAGFLGKSAQFPLHVWLPDAMAGPTPISALIHAATMVAAGIYFLCRIDFLFPEIALDVVLWLGAGMALYAGLCALAQRDIKKILAYSTLSQLGYMAAAFGLGYSGLAMFHLTCHAFFKALLFLGAGSVIHACHHEQDIFKMGGLWRRMPLTTVTFIIGTAALCAVTFFSGYYSKDAIIEAAFFENKPIFIILIISAYLTSIYMGRLLWVAFFGQSNSECAQKAHESPWVMTLPLMILAFLSIVGGLWKFWPDLLQSVINKEMHCIHEQLISMPFVANLLTGLTSGAWILGLLFACLFYRWGAKQDRLAELFPSIYQFLFKKLWIDEIYNGYVKYVQDRVAAALGFLDVMLLANVCVRGLAGLLGGIGMIIRSLHTGNLQHYVYWFLLGLIGVFYWIFTFSHTLSI